MKAIFVFLTIITLCKTAKGQFKDGYYYTQDGRFMTGQLAHEIRPHLKKGGVNFLLVKREGKGYDKFSTKEVSAFVIGERRDSFTVLRNFCVGPVTYKEDFARVLVAGKINLYEHMTPTSYQYAPYNSVFIIEKNGENMRWTQATKKEVADKFFADNPAIMQKIKETKWDNMNQIEIVREYNSIK